MTSTHRNRLCDCGSWLKHRNCHGATLLVPGTADGPGAQRYGGTGAGEKGTMLHLLMPTRGTVCVETMLSVSALGWDKEQYARLDISRATFLTMPRLGVAEARERLAEAAIRGMDATPGADHALLWIDDDCIFTVNDILALLSELRRNPDIALISSYYSPKVKGHPGFVPRFKQGDDGHEHALLTPGVDFQPHNIVEVPWVGLHCAIMRGEALRSIKAPYFPFDPATGCGEDVGFSHKLRAAGWKLAVHAGIIVPHVNAENGEQFVPDVGAKRLSGPRLISQISA